MSQCHVVNSPNHNGQVTRLWFQSVDRDTNRQTPQLERAVCRIQRDILHRAVTRIIIVLIRSRSLAVQRIAMHHPRRRNGSKKIPNVKLRPSTSSTREGRARARTPVDEEDGEPGEHFLPFSIGNGLILSDASWIK